MPRTVIFLEYLSPGEKGIAEMLAPVSIRRLLTLCFSIVSPGFLCFYGDHRSLNGKPWHLSLGGRPKGTEDSVPSNDFPSKWGRVLEVASSAGTPS
jgi:hypothetical protein